MGEIPLKNPTTCQRPVFLGNGQKWFYDHPLDIKKELVFEFVKMMSDMEHETCDKTENRLQKILYKTRGLIHKDLNRPKSRSCHV